MAGKIKLFPELSGEEREKAIKDRRSLLNKEYYYNLTLEQKFNRNKRKCEVRRRREKNLPSLSLMNRKKIGPDLPKKERELLLKNRAREKSRIYELNNYKERRVKNTENKRKQRNFEEFRKKEVEISKRFIGNRKKYINSIKLLIGCENSNCIFSIEIPEQLHFHHINPKEKEFSIAAGKGLSLDRIKNEIGKCIVLCANCHSNFHNGDLSIEGILKPIVWERIKERKPDSFKRSIILNRKRQEQFCTNCGLTLPIICLHFHHIKDKKFKINKYESKHITPKDLEDELDKCILVCANCHPLIHYRNKENK